MRVAAPMVVAVRLGLWVLPGPLLRGVVRHSSSGARASSTVHDRTHVDAQRIADAVRRAAAGVPRASCLVQAVSTQALLALAGSPGRIVLGVARTRRGLAAHAWVEHGGKIVIGEGAPPDYTVLGALHPVQLHPVKSAPILRRAR